MLKAGIARSARERQRQGVHRQYELPIGLPDLGFVEGNRNAIALGRFRSKSRPSCQAWPMAGPGPFRRSCKVHHDVCHGAEGRNRTSLRVRSRPFFISEAGMASGSRRQTVAIDREGSFRKITVSANAPWLQPCRELGR